MALNAMFYKEFYEDTGLWGDSTMLATGSFSNARLFFDRMNNLNASWNGANRAYSLIGIMMPDGKVLFDPEKSVLDGTVTP